jgi:hypothetical protein
VDLFLEYSNVYFFISISRNIISISCMDIDGFSFSIKDQYFFYRDGIFYGNYQVLNDLYVLKIEKIKSLILIIRDLNLLMRVRLSYDIIAWVI